MMNPHRYYIISFLSAILIYQLGWSKICPPLSTSLLIFIGSTIIFHFLLSLIWRKQVISFPKAIEEISPIFVTIFLYCLWMVEFIYEGGVPFIRVMMNQPSNYQYFGVPSLHVFTVTFASFYAIFIFHLYLVEKKPTQFLLYLINLAPSILIYNRGMLIFILIGSLFVSLSLLRIRGIILIPVATLSFILFLYVFGAVGTIRQSVGLKSRYNENLFLDTGQATNDFRNSLVPKEFFWSYMYIASPLANLQTNIYSKPVPALENRLIQFVNNEMLFDFISKRINKVLGWERASEKTIPGPFNVSTVYSRSFSYEGWVGIFLMALFVAAVPWIYFWLLPRNPYALTGVSILCCMYLFLGFDNVIRFSGLGFQLVYPFAIPLAIRAFSQIKNKIAT